MRPSHRAKSVSASTILLLVTALLFAGDTTAHHDASHGNFASEEIADGFVDPTDVSIAPDGTVFVA